MVDTAPEEKQRLKQFLESVMQTKNVRGDVIFSSVAGSHSFNLAVATSDSDYFGVYQGHIDDVLSLVPPPETFDSHTPDYSVFELLMFCKLVLKGNPKLIEPLFATHLCYYNEDWVELLKVRHNFLSKSVVAQYLSYVHSQLKDIQRGEGEKKKKYYHALRLLGEARRMVEGGTPKVWMDGEERDYLMSVRKGEREEDELVEKVAQMQEEVKAKLESSDLREKADAGPLNDWLVQLRRNAINRALQESPQDKFDIKPVNESPESMKMLEKAQSTLAKHGIKATVLYYGPSGSSLHGRYTDGLEDSICIYAVPTDSIVSLDPPPNKLIIDEEKSFHSDTYTRGMACFEILYAMSMLAQGNHRMNELLWLSPTTPFYSTNAWEELRNSVSLVTVHAMKHYHGIARGTLDNLGSDGKEKRKNKKVQPPHRTLYHAFRCLWCAEAIANGNVPHLEHEKDKELLVMLKKGEGNVEELTKRAREEEDKLRKLIATVEMKDFDRAAAGKWLAKLRKSL